MFAHDGLMIRALEEGDLERLRALRNEPSTWMMLTHVGFLDAEGQRQWFQHIRTAEDPRYYVICDEAHDFIGIVRTDALDRTNRSLRVGADIVPELRGRGYGRRSYELLKRYCFDYLNMHRIWLLVLADNARALHLYERQGFRVEGRYREAVFRHGVYHDYVVLSLLEHEYRGGP